jgi:hypothetical protein
MEAAGDAAAFLFDDNYCCIIRSKKIIFRYEAYFIYDFFSRP